MSPEIGPVAWGQEDEPVFIGKEIARKKDFSEETARTIDAAVKSILDQSRALAESVIRSHREELDRLSEELLLRETLEDSEVRKLLGLPEKNGGAAE